MDLTGLPRGPVNRQEELREILELPLFAVRRALNDWLAYASRSKLAPFVKLARSIRHYRASIEATIEWQTTNGFAESNNAAIGRIRTNARGFHGSEAFSQNDDHARPSRHQTRTALGHSLMTHDTDSCPQRLTGSEMSARVRVLRCFNVAFLQGRIMSLSRWY